MVPRVSETGRTGGALTRPDLPGKKITLSTTASGPYCKAFLPHSHTRPSCTAVPVPFPFRLPGSSCHSPIPPPPIPTDSAYTLRETNDGAAAERGACPAHKPQGWVTSGVAMAANTHPISLRTVLPQTSLHGFPNAWGHLSVPTSTPAGYIHFEL